MDQRALVDIVCKTGLGKMGGEIGALLGQELSCSDIQLDLTTKHQIFSRIDRDKSALTRMTVGGDREGNCYLLSSMKAAIVLGGTLIMLPEDVIEEQVADEKLDGEINDAFGEIANIVAGVMTQAFVDKYPKTLRFIKKTVEELVPTKIDPDSDSPFPVGEYYLASCHMEFEGADLGRLEFIVPAAVFDLATAPKDEPQPEAAAAAEPAPQPAAEATPPPSEKPAPQPAAPAPAEAPPAAEPAAAPAAKKPKFADAKKLADVVFKAGIGQIGEEVGALLGQTLKCDDIQLVITSRAEFFSNHCTDKSVLTKLKISGDRQGTGYLAALLPDAIVLGGTLIMLPEDVIEEEVAEGDLSGEAADAYGEIANIIAGGLTEAFLERYPKQMRFVKTDSDILVPTKIDPSGDEPFPEGDYYLASFAVHMDGFDLHRFLLLFPADVFDLDAAPTASQAEPPPQQKTAAAAEDQQAPTPEQPAPGEWGGPPLPESSQPAASSAKTETTTDTAASAAPASGTVPSSPAGGTGEPLVLLISDQKSAADPFVEILTSASYQCRVLSFQDEIREVLHQHQVLGIFLIMSQVGEKGFAAAIKLQSAGRPLPPLIFAGSQWTRSAVLRAVKYGAKDILVTPATGSEIQDKASQHFRKAS